MSKEKFHTSHHCERRYHKNGIQRPKKTKYLSLAGVMLEFNCQCNLKFLRNRRRAIKFDKLQNKTFVVQKRQVKKVEVKAVKAEAKAPKVEKKKEAKKDTKKDAPKDAKKESKKQAKTETKKQEVKKEAPQ